MTELSSTQMHVLLKLLFTGDEFKLSEMKPALSPKSRNKMIREGLIEVEKKEEASFLKLTDRGWAWAFENMDKSFPAHLRISSDILQNILTRLKIFLDQNDISLAEFITMTTPPSIGEKGKNKNTEEKVKAAYFHVTGGKPNVRVRLSVLRNILPELNKSDLDRILKKMQLEEKLVLYSLDDPTDIKPEDELTSIDIAGQKRHIVYMEG